MVHGGGGGKYIGTSTYLPLTLSSFLSFSLLLRLAGEVSAGEEGAAMPKYRCGERAWGG